ncbi:hypothetical protein [Planococcus sp. CAU13]|uniref:hypothetical protein n=1 Tax=Planococcus sp. CAU13 TaxID=1541197 RepID=UPI00052FFD4B|nr:hypothetical protein [Planococcus sp. CAU13]
MRRLAIISMILSAIVLLIHILFDLNTLMPGLSARILIAVFTLVLLSAGFYLYPKKERITH